MKAQQPAFPFSAFNPTEKTYELMGNPLEQGTTYFPGLSIRQYIAIHSPVSMIDANESLHQTAQFGKPSDRDAFPIRQVIAESVRLSVMYADLLLAELAKDQSAPAQPPSLSDKDPA